MNNNTVYDEQLYKALREEWDTGYIRVLAARNLGHVCFNCGSDEATELHHVVPLKCGGTNNLSNIVVLCHRCHCAAHHGQHIRDYCNKKITGRPHKVEKEALNEAIDDYVNCRIGAKECKDRIGLSQKTKIGDMSFYKNYLNNKGIRRLRNNIDIILNKRGDISNGDKAGYIQYINGNTVNIYYGV